jgi:hypothetical protein
VYEPGIIEVLEVRESAGVSRNEIDPMRDVSLRVNRGWAGKGRTSDGRLHKMNLGHAGKVLDPEERNSKPGHSELRGSMDDNCVQRGNASEEVAVDGCSNIEKDRAVPFNRLPGPQGDNGRSEPLSALGLDRVEELGIDFALNRSPIFFFLKQFLDLPNRSGFDRADD